MTHIAHDLHSAAVSPPKRFALFDYGFRPFFLLAGWYALLTVPVWLYVFAHHAVPFRGLPAMYWHSHEMLYGFVAAAIAGFLLTAVPSWTGARGFGGKPLMIAVSVWAAGRLVMACANDLPIWLVAVVELAFLPTLAALLAPPLLRSRNRNTRLLAVLAVLWLIDAAFLVALSRGDATLASRAMTIAIDLILILVTIIGGRIVPAFTGNALRRRGESVNVVSRKWVEVAVIGSMIAIAVVDALSPTRWLSAALAAFAAIVHAVRLSGWRSFKTRSESILWVLHVGYAWLPIGLALKACWLFAGVPWAAKWLHALTMGVFATMILAVMTRASLGHTGRPLVVSRAITLAYTLLTIGVIARVFGSALWPERYVAMLCVAGTAWVLSFLIYVVAYTPILVGPRADGKPG
ncbi:MAG TPA: NnrS family protein [Steroidobacteraceae bacterium]|nr:NnrS family protein [Steroidobacteraceae bacterium]